MSFYRIRLGREGEDRAADYLKSRGLEILERSWRSRLGELDLVAQDRGTLVFVEVKTRKNADFGPPESAVTLQKQKKIAKSALSYIKEKALRPRSVRFDVVALEENEIRWIPNAFESPLKNSTY